MTCTNYHDASHKICTGQAEYKERAGEQRGVTPCRKASLQWIVTAAGKCPQERTDPYLPLLVAGKPIIGGAEGAAPANC